ncbi:hypothetical protein IDH44_10070 [Paenibacillus sp. IB182496]|uniref:Uncharacterized protein n=1 Tax=Paenibacillus sabuli TaxID=2772509 RepID=A0A927GS04_9BACL|nr:hypothetical protein [Paenibacillus sabuli]MBD2845535.1 hypothetical protein [Paenibacillus sabuli]
MRQMRKTWSLMGLLLSVMLVLAACNNGMNEESTNRNTAGMQDGDMESMGEPDMQDGDMESMDEQDMQDGDMESMDEREK